MTPGERYNLRIQLGDGWTEQQLEDIHGTYLLLVGEDDSRAEQLALLRAVAAHVAESFDRDQLLEEHAAAQVRAQEARHAVRAALRVEVAMGMSESDAARLYRVLPHTVRLWTGTHPGAAPSSTGPPADQANVTVKHDRADHVDAFRTAA